MVHSILRNTEFYFCPTLSLFTYAGTIYFGELHLHNFIHPGLPGKPFIHFLTFFWRQKPFCPSFCEKPFLAFFLSALYNCPKMPFSELIFTKKIPGAEPPDPHRWKGKSCRTHHTCRIGAHHGTAHRFIPSCLTKKKSVKKMLEKTNLWLKPWLNVTNSDHTGYLWVCRHISMA